MSTRPDATISTPFVRGTIDFRRLPWIRPLVTEYAERFSSVAPLFAGNPAEPAAWRDTIARVTRSARHRDLVSRVLADQLADTLFGGASPKNYSFPRNRCSTPADSR